jgi:hypothetical protein
MPPNNMELRISTARILLSNLLLAILVLLNLYGKLDYFAVEVLWLPFHRFPITSLDVVPIRFPLTRLVQLSKIKRG